MSHSRRKKVLEAALKALLASADTAWWVKGPATFIAELSPKIEDLPDEQKDVLVTVSEAELRDALTQIDLTRS